jgi:hypothetical protein
LNSLALLTSLATPCIGSMRSIQRSCLQGDGDVKPNGANVAVALPQKRAKPEGEGEGGAAANAEYKEKLRGILKDRSDLFEDMVEGEEGVRLGEQGWKARCAPRSGLRRLHHVDRGEM